jgi:hypothetical protein
MKPAWPTASIDGAVVWERQPVTIKADEALAMEMETAGDDRRRGPEPKQRNGAAEWLRELLADGAIRVGDSKKPEPATIAQAAKDAGLSWGTVRRAREALGVKPYKGPFGDGWYWKLPPIQDAQDDAEDVQGEATCAPLGEPAHLRDFAPKNAVVGLPDAPDLSRVAHLRAGPSNGKELWNGNGEGAQDARVRGEL